MSSSKSKHFTNPLFNVFRVQLILENAMWLKPRITENVFLNIRNRWSARAQFFSLYAETRVRSFCSLFEVNFGHFGGMKKTIGA